MDTTGPTCQPGCQRPAGHISEYPCGEKLHTPGDPCRYCSKATPLDGGPCPDCWVPLDGMPLADIKALFASSDLSVSPPEVQR